MAFGQASGPPAAVQQLNRLAELLAERGFDSFKEARHPFGLTQRQAAGKFSSGEASELIERLEAESVVSAEPLPSTTSRASSKKPAVPAVPAAAKAASRASRASSSKPSRSSSPAAGESAGESTGESTDTAQVGSSKTTGAEVPQSAAAQARAIKKRKAREEEVATRIESEVMANELVSRGWCCIAPE
jgi:hypothetical protein